MRFFFRGSNFLYENDHKDVRILFCMQTMALSHKEPSEIVS